MLTRRLRSVAVSGVFALALVISQVGGVAASSGYDTGNLGQCYTYGYLYSTTARLTTYYWKNFGLT